MMSIEVCNPAWRLSNLYKIKTKQSSLIKFKPNNIQRKLNEIVKNDKRYIILKARQFGISTDEILKIFDKTIWYENVSSCILAHERDALEKLFSIVRTAYDNMLEPKPILAKGGGSKYELEFPEIRSKIYVDLEVRGGTNHNLHVSELAFFKDRNKFDATLETVPLDGHVSIETTPAGMNFFYDMWVDKSNGFLKLFFPWYDFEEYVLHETSGVDFSNLLREEAELVKKAQKRGIKITKEQIAFRRFKQGQLKDLFLQEYPEDDSSCFLASGKPFFNLEIIKERLNSTPEPIKKTGNLTIFENPKPNEFYVAGADTAEGTGHDFSVMAVYNLKTRKQVATLRGQWRPRIFAERMIAVLNQYLGPYKQQPVLAVERNNHGHAVILALQNLNYSNIFIDADDREGWNTTRVSRPVMLDALRDFVETTPNNINCQEFLRECLTFVDCNGKIEAISGKHDDVVIANAIAVQMLIKHATTYDYNAMLNNFCVVKGGI